MNKKIKKIIKDALNIQRWADKDNITYSFIEEDERKEMVENIIKELKLKGYTIIKKI